MSFNGSESVLVICVECESEFSVKTHFSEHAIRFCPFCATEFPVEEEEII